MRPTVGVRYIGHPRSPWSPSTKRRRFVADPAPTEARARSQRLILRGERGHPIAATRFGSSAVIRRDAPRQGGDAVTSGGSFTLSGPLLAK
jgi:hypothetical protein